MSPKLIIKLLFVLSIVAIAVALFSWNSGDVTVQLAPDSPMTMPLAVALIVSFAGGLLLTAVVAVYNYLKQSMREKQVRKQLDFEISSRSTMEDARALLSAKEFKLAESSVKKIISKNPDNTSARLLLSECFMEQGAYKEALLVLDNARQEDRGNAEVLFTTAELNEELGNLTAALDNLELLLKAKPQNLEAIRRASDISWELGDLERAIDFKKRQIKLQPGNRDDLLAELSEIEFEQLLDNKEEEPKRWVSQLGEFLKRHRDYPPALELLGEQYLANGENSKASKFLYKAFIAGGNANCLEKMASRLLETSSPEKAVDMIKKALSERESRSQETSVRGHLFFGALLLHLNNPEGAKEQIEILSAVDYMSADERALLTILKADLTQRESDSKTALLQVKSALLEELRIAPPALIDSESEGPLLIEQEVNS